MEPEKKKLKIELSPDSDLSLQASSPNLADNLANNVSSSSTEDPSLRTTAHHSSACESLPAKERDNSALHDAHLLQLACDFGDSPESASDFSDSVSDDGGTQIFSASGAQLTNHRSLMADRELTLYSMFHHSMLSFLTIPGYYQNVEDEIADIYIQIFKKRLEKLMANPNSERLYSDAFKRDHTTCIFLNKTESSKLGKLLNNAFYVEMTGNFLERKDEHLQYASAKYFASSYQTVSTPNPNLYEYMANSWKNENLFCIEDTSISKLSRPCAIFREHLIISCLMSSPLCKNVNHGSTIPLKDVLKEQNLNKDKIVKYGLAKLLACCQELDMEECDHLDVLAVPCPPFEEENFRDEALKRRNAVKQPAPDAYSLANHAIIPNFSLVDGSEELEYIFQYATHLFTSLFTIPPKLALWYLRRERSVNRLNQVGKNHHRQDYLMSMSAIIVDYPVTLVDCIKWARQLFTLLFDTNVRLANVQRAALNLPQLYPISIDDVRGTKQISNFLITTARLRARLYNLKDENRDEPSQESLEDALSFFQENLVEFEQVLFFDRFSEAKPYRKITHFTELADVCSLPSSEDLIIPGDPQFDPEHLRRNLSVKPIEPYLDDDTTFNFIMHIVFLRGFNFSGRFTFDNRYAEHYRNSELSPPYFRQASLFPQFL